MSTLQQMQNELFKTVFGKPEHAAGLLRPAMPAATAEALDWSTLAVCPGSFVDPLLAEHNVDVLFTVAWRAGGSALIYLVFENRSTVDALLGFRMLQCQVRIWERWLAEHAGASKLPMIIPVVLCMGGEQLSAAVEFDGWLDATN